MMHTGNMLDKIRQKFIIFFLGFLPASDAFCGLPNDVQHGMVGNYHL